MKNTISYIKAILPLLLCCNLAAAQNLPDDNTTAPTGSVSQPVLPQDYNQGNNSIPANFNYTRTWMPVVPMTDSSGFNLATGYSFTASTVRVKTDYLNGWGQPILSLTHRTHILHDMATVYDNRATHNKTSFLSYPTAYQNSHFQPSPYSDQVTYFQNQYPDEEGTSYSLTQSTASGGIQTTSTYSPGKSFVGQGRGASVSSQLNTASENIRIWHLNAAGLPSTSAVYGDNTLVEKIATGQHDAQVVEYTDKDNQLVCKKVYTGNNNWLYTYYVYDDFGKIRYIITPKAVAALAGNNWQVSNSILTGLCFSYVYDKYGQVIQRSIPGKNGLEFTVYDRKHRPVLFQNAILQSQGKWQFTIYDQQGRTVMTGITSSGNNQSAWTSQIETTNSPTPGSLLAYFLNGFNGFYPNYTAIPDCEIREYNYYDSYDLNGALAGRSFDNSKSGEYLSGPEFVYPQARNNTYGLLTGKRTFIPGANGNMPSEWISSMFFYDQFGKLVQTQVLNPFNGNNQWDVSTTQYSFEGKPVLTIDDHHAWTSANKTATIIYKKYVYDLTTGRLKEVRQKTDNNPVWRYISQQTYDVLGRVADKKLGGVEHQVFNYNIRGQLTDMNKDFVNYPGTAQTQDMTFGLSLSYDYGFTNQRYDGAISGFIWRGGGSHSPRRAYGYNYDAAGRMTSADFREFNLASSNPFQDVWNNEHTDYSVSNIAYDENGNMLSMKQRGVDVGGAGIPQPVDIDDLTYAYKPNSNQLDNVEDAVSANYHLEDFVNNNAGSTDYTYDEDGNLKSDANKGINDIVYNHQDLPLSVQTNDGTITNIYDAAGNLLQKQIVPVNGDPTTYRYWGGFTYRNDSLLYVLHDEGRCRWQADSNKFKYDYFIKDHLGNVRTTVTADYGGTREYMATYELAAANTENLIFEGIDEHRAPKPGSTSYSDVKSALLNGQYDSSRVGTSILLKVMAGDKFNLSAYHYYDAAEGSNVSTSTEDMMSSIIGTLAGGTTRIGEETGGNPVDKLFNSPNYADVYDALKENATDPTLPRAYLNYLVFDEHMVIVPQQSGALQVSAVGNSWQQIALPEDITVGQNGYLVVYLSNEQHKNVFFDYLNLTYYRGRLLEEQHYYPHGLTIRAGANTPLANKYLYQGKQLQDELGLELYDFHARQYDPQIGRFWGIDPADQFPSGYTGMANDPANNIDPTGMAAVNNSGGMSYASGGTSTMDMLYNLDNYYGNENYGDYAGTTNPEANPGDTDPTSVYTSTGKYAGNIPDGSNNALVLHEGQDAMGVGLMTHMKEILQKGISVANFSGLMGTLGDSYDIDAFSKFYDQYHNSVPAFAVQNQLISDGVNYRYEVKGTKISIPIPVVYAEVSANLVSKGNIVTVGALPPQPAYNSKNKRFEPNAQHSPGSSELKYEKNKISGVNIHLHIFWQSGTLRSDMPGTTNGMGTFGNFKGGFNYDDMPQSHSRYRNVTVDEKNIYLYNNNNFIIIKR